MCLLRLFALYIKKTVRFAGHIFKMLLILKFFEEFGQHGWTQCITYKFLYMNNRCLKDNNKKLFCIANCCIIKFPELTFVRGLLKHNIVSTLEIITSLEVLSPVCVRCSSS